MFYATVELSNPFCHSFLPSFFFVVSIGWYALEVLAIVYDTHITTVCCRLMMRDNEACARESALHIYWYLNMVNKITTKSRENVNKTKQQHHEIDDDFVSFRIEQKAE